MSQVRPSFILPVFSHEEILMAVYVVNFLRWLIKLGL